MKIVSRLLSFYSLLNGFYLTGAILKGTPVAEKAHPYIAQVRSVDNYISTGTILDPYTVITEADTCIFAVKVYGGKVKSYEAEWEEQVRKVCAYTVHPKWGKGCAKNAWCFLHLSEPFNFDEYVSAVSLAPVGSKPKGVSCSVFGWGRTVPDTSGKGDSIYSDVLREAKAEFHPSYCYIEDPTVICIKEGPCGEDHGAPGICEGVLYSVTTLCYQACTRPGMASIPGMPRDWYEKVLADAVHKCNQTNQTTPIDPRPTVKPGVTTVSIIHPNPTITTLSPEIPKTTTKTTTTTTTTTRRTTTTRQPGESCCQDFTSNPNGNPIKPHSRPYMVQIHSKDGKISVGVLIDPHTVVTSPRNIQNIHKILAGKHYFGKQEETEQSRFHCYYSQHPNYNNPNNANGYGLIHISEPFIFNEYVNSVRAAPKGEAPSSNCLMIGWQGTSADTELREQPVRFQDPSQCQDAHPTVSCVEGGACLHDLGSPVVCTKGSTASLHAIVSSTNSYCEHGVLTSIPEIPQDWFSVQMKKAEILCRWCPSSCRNP